MFKIKLLNSKQYQKAQGNYVSLQWGEAARLAEKQRTAGSVQRTEKEGKLLWGKELKMVKIFLFFLDFGRGYLRVWPKAQRVFSFKCLVFS